MIIDELELGKWINYVNWWLSFWNKVEVIALGVLICWLIFITLWCIRINDRLD